MCSNGREGDFEDGNGRASNWLRATSNWPKLTSLRPQLLDYWDSLELGYRIPKSARVSRAPPEVVTFR